MCTTQKHLPAHYHQIQSTSHVLKQLAAGNLSDSVLPLIFNNNNNIGS